MVFCFCFYCLISSFIAMCTIKGLHTFIIGKGSKSRQQMSPALSIEGGKASTECTVSGTTVKSKNQIHKTKTSQK